MVEILNHLREARTDWKDEIPARIVHSNDPDNRYKIRSGWIVGVRSDCALLTDPEEEVRLPDSPQKLAATLLVDYFMSPDFLNRSFNTAQDIQIANTLIDIILME